MRETKFKFYNNGTKTIKVYKGQDIPDGYVLGQLKKRVAWNKGLNAETDERVKINSERSHKTRKENGTYIAWNKGLTKEDCPSLGGKEGKNNPMYGKHPNAWNKGLTKETNESVNKISQSNKGKEAWNKGKHSKGRTMTQKEKEFYTEMFRSEEFKQRKYETMKNNGTLGKNKMTKAEIKYYESLLTKYDENDIVCQYFDKERYPFRCDFYIKSEDMFIEVNANWTHGKMPFDENNPNCLEKLNEWKEKAKTSDYYKQAIYVWTDLDPRKVRIAKENSLNYKVIY